MAGTRSNKFRAFSFFAVLILVSSVAITLFSQASAGTVSMEWVAPASSIGGSATFVVDMVIAQNDRVPILAIDAILEQQAPGQNSKFGASVITRSRCAMAQEMD